MIISIIERLARRERKYIPFQDWVLSRDEKIECCLSNYEKIDVNEFKKIIKSLKKDYYAFLVRNEVLYISSKICYY